MRNIRQRLPAAGTDACLVLWKVLGLDRELYITRFAGAKMDSLEAAQISDGIVDRSGAALDSAGRSERRSH